MNPNTTTKKNEANKHTKRRKEIAMQQVDAKILDSLSDGGGDDEYEVPKLPPPLFTLPLIL